MKPSLMKAVIHKKYGPPSVLETGDVEMPSPQRKEVLVSVRASTVNRSDCAFRSGKPFIVRFFSGLLKPNSLVPGTEFAGVVSEIGSDVGGFAIGDEVYGRQEDESAGAHAEYMVIHEDAAITHIPDGVSFSQAAALSDGAMLASPYLRLVDFDRAPRILVNGASGAIGSASVQLAKSQGAEVTAVCKTEAISIIQAIGADHVIDYVIDDFTKIDAKYEVVIDAVGKSSFGRCQHLLTEGGIYFSSELGFLCQNPLLALRTRLFGGKLKVHFPLPKYEKAFLIQLNKLVQSQKFTSVIDREYSLDQIVEAHQYVETGEKIGNVVVVISE